LKEPLSRNIVPLPERIERYFVRTDVLEETSNYFQQKGKVRHEAYVLWAGTVPNQKDAYVTCCVIPKVPTSSGRVSIGLRKLLAIHDELTKRRIVLLCQLHTHPGNFGHSLGDERQAANYRLGFISIVVPHYGRQRLNNLKGCYVYEYVGNWSWRPLKNEEVDERFIFEQAKVSI
jgi:hypothetical protein